MNQCKRVNVNNIEPWREEIRKLNNRAFKDTKNVDVEQYKKDRDAIFEKYRGENTCNQ